MWVGPFGKGRGAISAFNVWLECRFTNWQNLCMHWTRRSTLNYNCFTCNPTCTPSTVTRKEPLDNHQLVLLSFAMNNKTEGESVPSLYWIPKLHENPYNMYKERYKTGSSKCSTKPISKILTSIFTTMKEGLQKYCDEVY